MWGRMPKSKGKHIEKGLSATRVRTVSKPGRYADGNGLYLVVKGSSKQWILRTIVRGKRRDIGLGGLSVTPLAAAREEAARLRKIARSNGDPLAERRKERRVVPTFEEAAKKVHARLAPSFKNSKHSLQWINTLRVYVFPMFGDQRLDDVETSDVLKTLEPFWLTKPETARRVRQRIRAVFDWAKASGFRSGDNPVDGLKMVLPKQPTTRRHFSALPYEEVATFIDAICQSASRESVKLAFEFLILTVARTNEVISATWPEIDLKTKTWRIPASRMKAGREHRVPLSLRCLEILRAAKQISDGGELIFPGQTPNKPLSNMAFLMTLRRMDRADITAHGFRSSFRDWAEERTNYPRTATEAALAHVVKDKTEAAYRRTDLFEKRRNLMETWATFATAMQSKVVRIRA